MEEDSALESGEAGAAVRVCTALFSEQTEIEQLRLNRRLCPVKISSSLFALCCGVRESDRAREQVATSRPGSTASGQTGCHGEQRHERLSDRGEGSIEIQNICLSIYM